MPRPRPAFEVHVAARGFTLVELLIVVIILAIIAGVAIPRVNNERTEATVSSLMANVNLVGMTVEYHKHRSNDGDWPEVVDTAWFSSQRYPYHPDRPDAVPKVQNVDTPGETHPASKVLSVASAGAYWYNAANGQFRSRVRDMGDASVTLEMYNRVNQSSLTSLTATKAPPLAAVESALSGAELLGR